MRGSWSLSMLAKDRHVYGVALWILDGVLDVIFMGFLTGCSSDRHRARGFFLRSMRIRVSFD